MVDAWQKCYNPFINGFINSDQAFDSSRMGDNSKGTSNTPGQTAALGGITTRVLSEMVLMIALSGALFFIRPFILPQGGSITMGAMIPVILFSIRRGPRLGIFAGVIFGLIVLTVEPFVVHPIQFLLDYPVAFGALGLAGFFKKWHVAGVGAAILGRFLSHFVSGIVFFAAFAPEGIHPALYSAVYNGSYLGIEFVVSGIIIYGLLKRGILNVYR